MADEFQCCSKSHWSKQHATQLHIANKQLTATEEQPDLGIIIAKDLKWQKQTEKVIRQQTG